MKPFRVAFSIVEEKNCPLYRVGERLLLSERTIACPEGKEVCLILVRDMTQLLFRLLAEVGGEEEDEGVEKYNCSGCTGLIKFSKVTVDLEKNDRDEKLLGAVAVVDPAVKVAIDKIVDSPFLQVLPADQIEELFSHFKEISLEEGAVLIRKGEKNLNFYLLFEGTLQVESDGVLIATLKVGELCGEMSYFSPDVAVSTVKAIEKSKVLAIAGDDFGRLLGSDFAVQGFVAQLLAKRLRKTTVARARDFESCMRGRLDEIVPAELFQIFHMHQKTGVLAMELPAGTAKVSFREGCLINASYAGENNQQAIFKILAEKNGVYRFTSGLSPQEMKAAEIGDFMMLLMEGVKRVDEELED